MKLSRIFNCLEDIPTELRDYYEVDHDGNYVINISGMVPNSKLKEFRKNNIKLSKQFDALSNEYSQIEHENRRLLSEIDKANKKIQAAKKSESQTNEYTKIKKVLNTFKKHSTLKRIATSNDPIRLNKIAPTLLNFDGVTVKISGKFIKTASIRSESYEYVKEIELLVECLKNSNNKVDIFTFIQSPPFSKPIYKNQYEIDNLAVMPIDTYEMWWNNQIKDKTRNLVRKAKNNHVSTKLVKLDDELINGITEIFNESKIRQGRLFPHYGKTFDQVKKEISTFPDKSDFIGAYLNDELIGFAKIVYSEKCANFMQILSKLSHRDKATTNALIAKSVEICCEKNVDHLVYRKFIYGKKGPDHLTEFKAKNGFIKYFVPRYYIPITMKGKLAIILNIHKGIKELIPEGLYAGILKGRKLFHNKKHKFVGS